MWHNNSTLLMFWLMSCFILCVFMIYVKECELERQLLPAWVKKEVGETWEINTRYGTACYLDIYSCAITKYPVSLRAITLFHLFPMLHRHIHIKMPIYMLERCKYSRQMYCNCHYPFYRALHVVCLLLKVSFSIFFRSLKLPPPESPQREGKPQPHPGCGMRRRPQPYPGTDMQWWKRRSGTDTLLIMIIIH
jgi:hypothetical protein